MNKIHIVLWSVILLIGCGNTIVHPGYKPSNVEKLGSFESFDEYIEHTHSRLINNRIFVSSDHEKEIQANLPYEILPVVSSFDIIEEGKPTKGIILIHGLGDSPWSFVDIGYTLAQKGFLVRTILLDGHGTRPADLIDTDYQDWIELIDQHVELLKSEVDQVYLGGFSTGANLAYLHAANDSSIAGLMLFSPGFRSSKSLVSLTPLLSNFKTWIGIDLSNIGSNYTRYSEVPVNGYSQYYLTSKAVMDSLDKRAFERPTFIVLSEHDSVLNSEFILDQFESSFTHDENRLVWFGTTKKKFESRVIYIDSFAPKLRISNMSHMGVLFNPRNPYYGVNGSEVICDNGQLSQSEEAHCLSGGEVWFSGYGYQEPNKVHARSTYNPAYDEMISTMADVFNFKDSH